MFRTLPIKQQYLLPAVSLLLMVICYQLAFKKTLEAWQTHKQLKTQLTASTDIGFQPGFTERKNNNLNKILELYQADTANFRSNIIDKITSIAAQENVKLSEVPGQDLTFRTQQFSLQKLEFEGDYFSLIKTLNHLQATPEIGMIRSITLKAVPLRHHSDNELNKLMLSINLEIKN